MSSCGLCELDTTAVATVHRDELWSLDVPPGPAPPGWYQLRVRRHVESWGELTPAEAAAYGVLLRRVSHALTAETGSPKMYMMSFGENHSHIHALVISRPVELAHEHRGVAFLPLRDELIDTPAALQLASRVASRLAADAL